MRRAGPALLAVLLWLSAPCASSVAEPRLAQVAGGFYPADPDELRRLVGADLDQYPAVAADVSAPRILILPHAGYPYSGPVAARGFREIQGRAFDAVVVIGFLHRDTFAGSSVDEATEYRTPLGPIPVDAGAADFLRSQPGLSYVEAAHQQGEHSLEVMLPFLQVALGQFKLVPIMMGSISTADAQALATALAALAHRGNYLFIFSSDLSHYHPYDDAKQRDEATIGAMLHETPQAMARLFDAGHVEACGRGPIVTALFLAQQLGYPQRRLLLAANSGDTTGDKGRVVGYSAIGMYEQSAAAGPTLSRDAGEALVRAARETLRAHYAQQAPQLDWLAQQRELSQAHGMFVTLRRVGELRGCIGRITSDVPLAQLLPTVALDAALRDTRFSPVTADEVAGLDIEVSVLTPPAKVSNADAIVAGRDGVVLRKDDHSGVFLPQVWDETGWTRVEFLRELASQKAGLDADAWRDAELFTFQDQAFDESESPVASAH